MSDGKFAFPVTPEVWATHSDFHGMTLRDWFAGQALTMFVNDYVHTQAAIEAYKYADAMLAAREQAA